MMYDVGIFLRWAIVSDPLGFKLKTYICGNKT